MKVSFKLEGLKELDQALGELPKATGKNVLRRVGRKAMEPIMQAARATVPVDKGKLKGSLKVATRLSKRQAALHRRLVKDGKASIEMFAGPSAFPHAHLVEFGTARMKARPFMRPAWDANKQRALEIIRDELGTEIKRAADRHAKKAARLAAKGK